MDDESARDARREKYGGWAQNLSDAEAKKIVHDYGDIAYLFKSIIENVFGEKYSYSVEDAQFDDESFTWCIFPEGNRFLDEIQITFRNPTSMIAKSSFDIKPSSLDCDFDDLLMEIYKESRNWDYNELDVPWELNLDTSDCYGDDDCYASCWVTIHAYHSDSGTVFQDLPTVDELDEYFENVNKIINSHKKK